MLSESVQICSDIIISFSPQTICVDIFISQQTVCVRANVMSVKQVRESLHFPPTHTFYSLNLLEAGGVRLHSDQAASLHYPTRVADSVQLWWFPDLTFKPKVSLFRFLLAYLKSPPTAPPPPGNRKPSSCGSKGIIHSLLGALTRSRAACLPSLLASVLNRN